MSACGAPVSPTSDRHRSGSKRRALMRDFEKYVLDDQAHEIFLLWWYRIVPYLNVVRGWRIGSNHYTNQDLTSVWLAQKK